MQLDSSRRNQLIVASIAGDTNALGELLEHHRPYLQILAKRYLDDRLRRRIGESDLIQQTCVAAVRYISDFSGQTEAEFARWLTTILEHQAIDSYRRHIASEKRSLNRERKADDSEAEFQQVIDQRCSSPSQRMLRSEAAVELARALNHLPARQSEAIRLKYLEGLSIEEVSRHLDTTSYAVAGLLTRGMKSLRQYLKFEEDHE